MKATLYYDKDKDCTYAECPLCYRRCNLTGTYEYGFFFRCYCGYKEEIDTEVEDIKRTVVSLQEHMPSKNI